MLTAKRPLWRTTPSVREPSAIDTSTRSGSSDTEMKALSVIPAITPSCSDATTVTPVANSPTLARKASLGIGEAGVAAPITAAASTRRTPSP